MLRGAAPTAVRAYGNRRHGKRSRIDNARESALIRSAWEKIQLEGASESFATRRSAAAIAGADRHVNVQRRNPSDDFQPLQSPGTTAPETGSVRSGVE